jgi:hypothetical protein
MDIDPTTVRFGRGEARAMNWPWPNDFNSDGVMDVGIMFHADEAAILCGDTELEVYGETWSGEQFIGSDSIQTINCDENSCHP